MGFRVSVVASLLILGSISVAYRLYYLQSEEHLVWLRRAAGQHQTKIQIQGARGNVVDRKGRLLAVSVPTLAVGVNPSLLKDKEAAADSISPYLGKDKERILEILEARKRFTWLARGLERENYLALLGLGLKGFSVVPEFARFYPQGSFAGQILGRVSRSGSGQSGIELAFNKKLSASMKKISGSRDARGRLVMTAARNTQASMRKEGFDIKLTIDAVVQNILEEEFFEGMKNSDAKRVFGLMLDAETGEIVSMAQVPEFDPNQKTSVAPAHLRNVSIQDSFEPGSTIKPLVAAQAIEEGVIKANHMMDCENGHHVFGRKVVRDVHPVGKVSFSEAVARSSNVCLVKVGQRLGKDRLHSLFETLQFGKRTGLELTGESRGILRGKDKWKKIDLVTHSFGHGLAVTALQMAKAYGAIANGGYLIEPSIIEGENNIKSRKRIFSSKTARDVSFMLEEVVSSGHGTGKNAAIPGVNVFGKTGTAHKLARTGGYDPDRVIGSFIGFAEGKSIGFNKKFVLFVAVDEPNVKPRWGGVVAAPIFRKVMERVVAHYVRTESIEEVEFEDEPGIKTRHEVDGSKWRSVSSKRVLADARS